MNRLCIISHTEHYYTQSGELVGLASTVQEINYLLALFDEIVHVAVLHPSDAPNNTMPYASDRIKFVPLPPTGGTGILQKLKVLYCAPKILSTINRALKSCDVFQFRAPTGMGVFVLPYLIYISKKRGWYKYAGNWQQANAPLSYRFQRRLLLSQSQFVTINGQWPHQPQHCLSFENPCLTDTEYQEGQDLCLNKTFQSAGLELCFVGRLEAAKGVDLLLRSLINLSDTYKQQITKVHIVGEGAQIEQLRLLAKDCIIPIEFYGLLSRSEVHHIYKRSHAIVLPSASEGFPKVIAEAMNYGCIPIVSDVSALRQYIQHQENGFLINSIQVTDVQQSVEEFLSMSNDLYKNMLAHNKALSKVFTYSHYLNAIEKRILNPLNKEQTNSLDEK